jgi:hypothetical protein
MATPTVSLSPLSIISPTVVGQTLSVESGVVPFTIQGDTDTVFLDISIGGSVLTLDSPVLVNGYNQFTGSININTVGEILPVTFRGRNFDFTNSVKYTPTLGFNILYSSIDPSFILVSPPSGVSIYKLFGSCKVEWELPENAGFLGVRLQWSTDPSGVSVPYTQFGDLIGSTVTRTDTSATLISNQVQVSSDQSQRVTVTTEAIQQVNYSSAIFKTTDVGNVENFYVILSTVVQDPTSNTIYESVYNGPFLCGFVDLRKATPTDFPYLQQREDIAGRMISEVLSVYPDIDLTPRSELRDLFIDPVSIELAEMSTREWFSRCASSISALSVLDDADGDGISDPIDFSTMKQQLARAWHLSGTDLQVLINKQFDLIGEWAGLSRGGPQTGVGSLTAFTYVKPTSKVTIGNIVAATVPDAETDSVQFATTASASMDVNNIDSYWDANNQWWAITLPIQCTTTGSVGNVGAQTIVTPVSGVPNGFSIINMDATYYGSNSESNANYANRIALRLIAGIDPGSKNGYTTTALATPGITAAQVVGSGDGEMLRDWDPLRLKHVYGTVDIYVRGSSIGSNTDNTAFVYPSTAPLGAYALYNPLTVLSSGANGTPCSLKIGTSLDCPVAQVLEIVVSRGSNQAYLGVSRSNVDYANGIIYLDPTEGAYQITGDLYTQSAQPLALGSVNAATNAQFMSYLSGASGSGYTLVANFRMMSPFEDIPVMQPVFTLENVAGEDSYTGVLSNSLIALVKSEDPLLTGQSNASKDTITYDSTLVTTVTNSNVEFISGGPTNVTLGTGILPTLDSLGSPNGSVVARSSDSLTLFTPGVDYNIVKSGPYGQYDMVLLPGSSIPLGILDGVENPSIQVSYNKLNLAEQLIFVQDEPITFTGTVPVPLANSGFVYNTWLPNSYGNTTLLQDTDLVNARVPVLSRYLKLYYNNGFNVVNHVTFVENKDYTVSVDSSGQAYLSRILTGSIPNGQQILVSYFRNEMFQVTTTYPAYVQQASSAIQTSRSAAADVLIKAMTKNNVDIYMTVEISSNTTADVVDPAIRTVLSLVLDQTTNKLTQSEIIKHVMGVQGVTNVVVPLTKFAKSDGSYDVGYVIPTGTQWTAFALDQLATLQTNYPTGTFISTNILLQDSTLPSGGEKNAYVGFLYEGMGFTRLSNIKELASALPFSFYIIGMNDQVDEFNPIDSSYWGKVIIVVPTTTKTPYTPLLIPDPSACSYGVTYQVWNEGGCKDILLSSCEYLEAGNIVINYISDSSSTQVIY